MAQALPSLMGLPERPLRHALERAGGPALGFSKRSLGNLSKGPLGPALAQGVRELVRGSHPGKSRGQSQASREGGQGHARNSNGACPGRLQGALHPRRGSAAQPTPSMSALGPRALGCQGSRGWEQRGVT